MRTYFSLLGAVLLFAVVPAFGTVYDYSVDTIEGPLWGLQKYNAGYWDAIYSVSTPDNGHSALFEHIFGEPTAIQNLGAYVWTAPEGEYITEISFGWAHDTQSWSWTQVAYTNPGETLNLSTPIAWATTDDGEATGSQTLTFTKEQQITSIGLGFFTPSYGASWPSWYIKFENPVITTVPEPMTLGMVLVGGLAYVVRRKRK